MFAVLYCVSCSRSRYLSRDEREVDLGLRRNFYDVLLPKCYALYTKLIFIFFGSHLYKYIIGQPVILEGVDILFRY